MKKKLVTGLVAVGVVGSAGIAYATIGGFLNLPGIVQGIATGNGSNSCQTGPVTFTVPDPTWSNSASDYIVSSLDYSGISTPCVTLATADLEVQVLAAGQSVASATASNMQASTGTLTLSSPVPYGQMQAATVNYLVKDN